MSALHPKILIIDGDPQIRRYLRSEMSAAGYGTVAADSGAQGLAIAAKHPPDAIVLDLDLADGEAKALLTQARTIFHGPILVLSAGGRKIQEIDALDLGADAVFAKPFSAGELLARLRAAFRQRIVASGGKPVVQAADLMVDLVNRTVSLRGSPVALSEQQYSLLVRLAEGGGRVLTHQDLAVDQGLDGRARSTQHIRLTIRQLRTKLEQDPRHPRLIETQHGVGYRLVVNR